MWKLVAPKGAGGDFEKQLVPVGIQKAVCYSVVDLGSQEVTREGSTFNQAKVQVTFETEHMGDFDGEKKPLVTGKRYTLSMSEKSNLYKDLTSWLWKKPDDDFDIMSMVGKTAQLQIMESTSKEGKTYHNINTILPSDHKQKLINEKVEFSLQNFEQKEFDKIPEWMQKIIELSPEFKANAKKIDDDLPFN